MTYGLDKSQKLCGETTVNLLFTQGASFIAYPVRVVWLSKPASKDPVIRILVSVPKKKLKHAVDRNRIKRLIRESHRLNSASLKALVQVKQMELQLSFIWIPTEMLEYARVEKKIKEALSKLERILSDEKALIV
jgi:ribonuclease P protein component